MDAGYACNGLNYLNVQVVREIKREALIKPQTRP